MPDVIEKLVEILDESFEHQYDKNLVITARNTANALIANGITFESDINVGSKWIPVTERLPEIPDGWAENPEPVLYMMASTRTIRAGYYGEGGIYRDKYFREYHDRYEGVDADDVLCWMWQQDLPQPPKGDHDENNL